MPIDMMGRIIGRGIISFNGKEAPLELVAPEMGGVSAYPPTSSMYGRLSYRSSMLSRSWSALVAEIEDRFHLDGRMETVFHIVENRLLFWDCVSHWEPSQGAEMTEQEWLTCEDPAKMLRALQDYDLYSPGLMVSDQKLRLWCWELAKRSGMTELSSLALWHGSKWERGESEEFEGTLGDRPELQAILWAGQETSSYELLQPEKAALLREIVGNPFRSYLPPGGDPRIEGKWSLGPAHSWLTWNDGVIPKIAQAIWDEKEFERMPILGDALEEAGCTDADILSHCRGLERCPHPFVHVTPTGTWPHGGSMLACVDCGNTGWRKLQTQHVRGCWVVDLVLGKE